MIAVPLAKERHYTSRRALQTVTQRVLHIFLVLYFPRLIRIIAIKHGIHNIVLVLQAERRYRLPEFELRDLPVAVLIPRLEEV